MHNSRGLPPREGTKIRKLYDVFIKQPGKDIVVNSFTDGDPSYARIFVHQLRNIYGLNIVSAGNGKYVHVSEPKLWP
jgi:hypothetical protein